MCENLYRRPSLRLGSVALECLASLVQHLLLPRKREQSQPVLKAHDFKLHFGSNPTATNLTEDTRHPVHSIGRCSAELVECCAGFCASQHDRPAAAKFSQSGAQSSGRHWSGAFGGPHIATSPVCTQPECP